MSIAVPSSAFTDLSTASTNNVVITKPASLAAGDLMVAILTNTGTEVPNTLAGWTLIQTQNSSTIDSGSNSVVLSSYWKVASSGDAAASNFTFTKNTNSRFGGGILRITGHGATISTQNQSGIPDSVSPSIVDTVTPSFANSLIIFPILATNTGGSRSTSAYAITTSNPSWTELWDTDSGGLVITMACAYAIRPEITATGNSTVTFSGGTPDTLGQLIVVPPVVDTTSTPSVISAIVSVQAPALSMGLTVTVSVASAVTTIPSVTVQIKVPFSNQSKNTTTWTNQSKHL